MSERVQSDRTLIVGFANLNFGRSWRAHRRDIKTLLENADVVGVVELRRPIRDAFRKVARVVQPRRSRTEAGSEAIIVRRTMEVLERGSERAYRSRHGFDIGWRRLVWVLVRLDDGTLVLVVLGHRVPLRMQGTILSAEQDARLRRRLDWAETMGYEWVYIGDQNQLIRADPAGLARDFHARWVGSRIDLAAVSRGQRIVEWREVPQPKRGDNHPFLYVTVEHRG